MEAVTLAELRLVDKITKPTDKPIENADLRRGDRVVLVEDNGTKYGTVSWVGREKSEIIARVDLVSNLQGDNLNLTIEFKQTAKAV